MSTRTFSRPVRRSRRAPLLTRGQFTYYRGLATHDERARYLWDTLGDEDHVVRDLVAEGVAAILAPVLTLVSAGWLAWCWPQQGLAMNAAGLTVTLLLGGCTCYAWRAGKWLLARDTLLAGSRPILEGVMVLGVLAAIATLGVVAFLVFMPLLIRLVFGS